MNNVRCEAIGALNPLQFEVPFSLSLKLKQQLANLESTGTLDQLPYIVFLIETLILEAPAITEASNSTFELRLFNVPQDKTKSAPRGFFRLLLSEV